jgi:hypothetical protein
MSKESKIKLLDFPKHLIKSILGYLTTKELLYPIMETNKKLNEFANDPEVITRVFFNQLKVPLPYGGAEFAALKPEDKKAIMKDLLWPSGINEKLSAMAYYTDGGVEGTDSKYFINNIYGENPPNLYSTKRGENVHIKALISDSLSQQIDLNDISKFKIPEAKAHLYSYPSDTYSYPIKSLIGNHEPQHCKSFAVLKYHDLNRNLTSYTSFLQSFALFISMEEIDPNHPLVQLFDGVKKIEQMEKLGFEFISLQNSDETRVVEFQLSSIQKVEEALQKNVMGAKLNGVYPFLWGQVTTATTNYLNIIQRIGFRFMLLKLIDSHKPDPSSNIDCYTISLSGNYVKLRHTHEE